MQPFYRWTILVSALFIQTPTFGMTTDYEGTIGDQKIGLTLGLVGSKASRPGNEVCGYYFYNRNLKNIFLHCEKDKKGDLVLYELDDEGRRTGIFKCIFPDKDPKGHFRARIHGEVMEGTWSKMDGSDSRPFYLYQTGSVGAVGDRRYAIAGVADDAEFESKVQKWRIAVLMGDKEAVASMFQYPISLEVRGKAVNIKSASELLSHYNNIFTDERKVIIRNTVPHNMFVRADGIMLGSGGAIWFNADGKVTAFNI
jgi:hypothetical protein